MSDNTTSPYGSHSVHVGAESAPASTPEFNRSIGQGPSRTHYVGTAAPEVRGPGLASQNREANVVRDADMTGKTKTVWAVQHHPITEPDGSTPFKGGEVTGKHVVDVPGVGQVRVEQALALGLIDPTTLGMPPGAGGKSLAMQQAEARVKGEPVPTADDQANADAAKTEASLAADYAATARDLDASMTSIGMDSDVVLTALASGDPSQIDQGQIEKLAEKMGADNYAQAIEAMELRVLDAASKALPQGADLDAVMDIVESPENAARWSKAWTHYLRSGDATLIGGVVGDVAKGMK